jgi:hypothetical protein
VARGSYPTDWPVQRSQISGKASFAESFSVVVENFGQQDGDALAYEAMPDTHAATADLLR